MIRSVKAFFGSKTQLTEGIEEAAFSFLRHQSSLDFSIEFSSDVVLSEVFLEIELESEVTGCRSTFYEWISPQESTWVANVHSPKMIRLDNGNTLVAGSTGGCWELDGRTKKLRWYFYHPDLSPLMTYDQEDRRHFLQEQLITAGTKISDAIFWTQGEVEEWARTPLGFVPTVCFTDHSDFDTLENLSVQREFFKSLGIRVTKGFFLYDYTHKQSNASFEDESSKAELIKWQEDGHELAYHALSQSYRGSQSDEEFQNFSSPKELEPVTTYIDHGFHPYNFTKQPLGQWQNWYSHMERKGIRLIWNYLDSGEGNFFAINQLNPDGFTLRNILKSARLGNENGIKRSRYSTLRNLLMFGVPEEIFWASKYFKGSLFTFRRKPSLKESKRIFSTGKDLFASIFSSGVLKNINARLDSVFGHSRFTPLFFKASNQKNTQIWVFQTLFVRDFDVVLSELALKKLVEEKGAFIAHTYFSYSNPGHEGRLFVDSSWKIREEAQLAFSRLGQLVQKGLVWNPTLSELKQYMDQLGQIEYYHDGDELRIRNFAGITRKVK
jgi:hypothetical protein